MTSENECTFTGDERDIIQGMWDDIITIKPLTPDDLRGSAVVKSQRHFDFLIIRKRDLHD